MRLITVAITGVTMATVASLGLDDPFRSGCVFNVVGISSYDDDGSVESDTDDITESEVMTLQGNVSADVIAGRDCVVIFKDLPTGKIRLNFRLPNQGSRMSGKLKEKEEEKQQRYFHFPFSLF